MLDLLLGCLLLHLEGIYLCLCLRTNRQIDLLKELSNLQLLELVLLTFNLVKHIVCLALRDVHLIHHLFFLGNRRTRIRRRSHFFIRIDIIEHGFIMDILSWLLALDHVFLDWNCIILFVAEAERRSEVWLCVHHATVIPAVIVTVFDRLVVRRVILQSPHSLINGDPGSFEG